MQTTNEQIRDKTIAHMINLHRYTVSSVKKYTDLLKQVEQDYIRQLKTLEIDNNMTVKQIDERLASVRAIINAGYESMGRELLVDSHGIATHELEWQQATIAGAVPVTIDFIAVAPTTLFAAIDTAPMQGKTLNEWFNKLNEDSYARVRDSVRMGVVEGQSYDNIVKRITGTKALQYTDGVTHLNRTQAQALVSTSVAHVNSVARQEFYTHNSDILKGIQWVSTLDNKTSSICQSLDGTVFPVDSGRRPPAHFRCRSTTTPIVKSWKELGIDLADAPAGTRASMDGQVPSTETYQSWLSKKSNEFQNDVLGVKKAELFRSGTPLDRFVDDTGKSYTLTQLRQLEL